MAKDYHKKPNEQTKSANPEEIKEQVKEVIQSKPLKEVKSDETYSSHMACEILHVSERDVSYVVRKFSHDHFTKAEWIKAFKEHSISYTSL